MRRECTLFCLFWTHQLYRILAAITWGRWRGTAIVRRRACANKRKAVRKAVEAVLRNNPKPAKAAASPAAKAAASPAGATTYSQVVYHNSREYFDIFMPKNSRAHKLNDHYSLYVEDFETHAEYCLGDYFNNESPKVSIVENGVILPVKMTKRWQGGVCDANGNFVAGHIKRRDISDSLNIISAYPVPQRIPHIKETVVYGGVARNLFGHMITEGLARMWWALENPDCGYKFVFLVPEEKCDFLEIYHMLGIPEENIVLITKPARFDKIIIPDQSHYLHHEFTDKTAAVYNAVRDSVPPAGHEKIYLTRTNLNDIVNEEYFEKYYENLGYKVLSPEKLSIRDQISILSGAKEIICTSGTLSHLVLFCHDGIKITILNRTREVLPPQFWMNQLRAAKCIIIDVSINFLPTVRWNMCYLFIPTNYWRQYISDIYHDSSRPADIPVSHILHIYLKQWTKLVSRDSVWARAKILEVKLEDVIKGMDKYLLDPELDGSVVKK